MRYVLVCVACGKERRSHKNPTKEHAPRLCISCHLDDQRKLMGLIMRKRGAPRKPPKVVAPPEELAGPLAD